MVGIFYRFFKCFLSRRSRASYISQCTRKSGSDIRMHRGGASGRFVRVNLFAISQNRRIGGIPSQNPLPIFHLISSFFSLMLTPLIVKRQDFLRTCSTYDSYHLPISYLISSFFSFMLTPLLVKNARFP